MWLVNTVPTFGVDFGTVSVGTVTVTITRSDGTAVVTDAATVNNNDGTYEYQLVAASNIRLDVLRLDWTVTSTSEVVTLYEEIVGSLLFTIDQARNKTITGNQTPLSDSGDYPDSAIARMRELVITQFESKTHRSWISRYCRTELHGNGQRELNLSYGHPRDTGGNESGGPGRLRDVQSLISVSIDGSSVALSEFELHGRKILYSTTWPRATYDNFFNVVVEYEYGLDPVDLEASENGLRMALANLVPSDLSAYALTAAVEGESLSFPQQHGGFVWPPKVVEWLERRPALLVG